MRTIHVVAALIFRDRPLQDGSGSGLQLFAAQRGYGDWKGWWEFPGGKVEAGEPPQEALAREIREELASEVSVGEHVTTIDYDYPRFHLHMDCYACRLVSGALELREHDDAVWLSRGSLRSVKWLPADELILPTVEAFMGGMQRQ